MIASIQIETGTELFYSFATSSHLLTDKTAGSDIRGALQSHLCQRLFVRRVQVFHERIGTYSFQAILENYSGDYRVVVRGAAFPTVTSYFKSLIQTPAQSKGARA